MEFLEKVFGDVELLADIPHGICQLWAFSITIYNCSYLTT